MQNNRIYVNDRLVDATNLTDEQWARLVTANRDSTKRRLVKCAWCWQEDHLTHWMKTYSTAITPRIVSHQPGESGDHPYQALESDEHKGYCDRTERVWTAEGGTAIREATASDGKTRSDVLLIGARTVSYEMQHSPFKQGYGATERTRRALSAGRDHVAWHTDSESIAATARVAMLRSNRAPLALIENPRYELRMLGGYRMPIIWTCTAREGHRCPKGRFSGCGATHFDTEPAAITLDDFVRKAPAGLILPVTPLDRRGYWTTAAGYELWQEHAASSQGLKDAPTAAARSRPIGEGHSRPRIEVRTKVHLDWRDSSHWATSQAPCRYGCGGQTHLRDEEGRPAHKTCAEQAAP